MSVSTKPASGFRDFLPADVRRREYVFSIIREVYESYGFEPLDTPCFERLTTLLGKYGEEGDQLIFKILQRGRKLERALESDNPGETDLADMGLRYDLTVPLARVFAEYRNELPSIFKRYQIAPVWRADRPQRGRFREFYQCDVDVVGSDSLIVEAEVTAALAEVLRRLKFKGVRIHLNNRQLLRAVILRAKIPVEKEGDALVAIDKLDKIGLDGVQKELLERDISQESVDILLPLLGITTEGEPGSFTNDATLAALEEAVGDIEEGAQAIADMRKLLTFAKGGPAEDLLYIDPYLARGLSYYTGSIFEIRSDDFSGSLGGGGRYDGLIGMFSKKTEPACGFSLGVERILVLMEERGMFDATRPDVDVLVTMWDDDFTPNSLRLANELRAQGLRVDIYAKQKDKYKKQFKYADERRIPVVAILAPRELENGVVALKDMKSGDQEQVPREQVAERVKAMLA